MPNCMLRKTAQSIAAALSLSVKYQCFVWEGLNPETSPSMESAQKNSETISCMTLFASLEDPEVGTRLAVAIGLHNLPEGLAVALPVFYATGSRGRAFLAALASGLAEPAGALLAFGALGGHITVGLVTGMAALVSGVMCWVSTAQLLPTALSLGRKETAAAGFGAGLLVMTLGIALLS